MKTLIENSIKVKGIGHSDTKTVFDAIPAEEMVNVRFTPLTDISNRSLSISFNYLENEQEKSDKIFLKIISSSDEQEIKSFILDQINTYLSK